MKKINTSFIKTGEKYTSILVKLRRDCITYIKGMIAEHGKITLGDEDDDCVAITYDGGSHPEYAGNPYSLVQSVYVKNDELYFEIEETDEYEEDRVLTSDLYSVADAIYYKFNKSSE